MGGLEKAVSALIKGEFVMLHDGKGRENEADMVLLAERITPEKVRQMRKDAGGLICVSMDMIAAKRLKLPFALSVLEAAKNPLAPMESKKRAHGASRAFQD